MTGRPATDLEPSALTARVELSSGERGGVRVSVRRSVDAETRGAAERTSGRPGREWIIAHGEQSRDFRCDGTGAGRDRRGAARAERARKRPRGSIRDGVRHPDRVRVSPRGARDAIDRSTPARTLRPLFSAKALCCSRWRRMNESASGAGNLTGGRGGAGDDGGDSSRGDGKGSHYYWCSVRSKMRAERR